MYAKIFSQIYDGTLCTNGPWQALVTFQQLLVLADQDGNVDMTAGAIARRTTIPLDIITLGIEELLKPDPESRTPAEEGRRLVPLVPDRPWGWRIVNYKHYRALKREEDRRDYHREYWRNNRSTKKVDQPANSTQTQHAQPNQPIAEAEAKAYAEEEIKRALPVSEAGLVCKAMKKAGVQGVNPSHPKLKALIDAGATTDEFTDAAFAAAQHGKGFAYALAVVEGRRKDAAKTLEQVHKGSMPVAETSFTKDRKSQAQAWMGKIKQPDTIDMEQTNVSRLKMD